MERKAITCELIFMHGWFKDWNVEEYPGKVALFTYTCYCYQNITRIFWQWLQHVAVKRTVFCY